VLVAGAAVAAAAGAAVAGVAETRFGTGKDDAIMARSSSAARLLRNSRHLAGPAILLLWLLGSGLALHAAPAAAKQTAFATPEQAVERLVAAARAGNGKELLTILGPGSDSLLRSGDRVADSQARQRFIAAYEEANGITQEGDNRAVLVVGKDDWPFPIPIVKHGTQWQFDSSAGAKEILSRRIGANELSAIEACRAYVAAQRDYAEKDRNHDGYVEYAQKFLSSPGRQDGLYWPAAEGAEESPLGPLMVSARAEGYSTEASKSRRAYHGYYYKILKAQGPAAKGGAYSYVVKGHMIGGFALVAFPARYGSSGVMTFIVNHDGIVYQKDLGPRTAELAGNMTRFNPDSSWQTP
jgi:hypothetical protein